MNANEIHEESADLAAMKHVTLLRAVHDALASAYTFNSDDKGRLVIDADIIAEKVKQRHLSERDIWSVPGGVAPNVVSLNVPDKMAMRQEIHHIYRALRDQFAQVAQAHGLSPSDLAEAYLEPDITTASPLVPIGAAKPQTKPAQQLVTQDRASRKEMTFKRPGNTPPAMRWHKVQIRVDAPADLLKQLADAILQEAITEAPSDRDDLALVMKSELSKKETPLKLLERALIEETVGQLKKEAMFRYLAFLIDQMKASDTGPHTIRDLQRRLLEFRTFLNDDSKTDEDYKARLLLDEYDLRAVFGRATAFDELPVIPVIDGFAGETTSTNGTVQTCTYTFGIKLKLNGKVTDEDNKTSFVYHLDKLRGATNLQRQRQVMARDTEELVRLAVLYYVAFTSANVPDFHPLTTLRRDVLDPLAAAKSPEQQRTVLNAIADLCKDGKPDLIVGILTKAIKRETQAQRDGWSVQLSVAKTILNPPSEFLEQGFLQPVFDPDRKLYLRHIKVAKSALGTQSLYKLDAQISIDDVHFYPLPSYATAEAAKETYEIEHDVVGMHMLKVYLMLAKRASVRTALITTPPPQPGIFVHYFVANPATVHEQHDGKALIDWFIYRYVCALISYLGIEIVASYCPQPLFITLPRYHSYPEGHRDDGEGFLATLGKVLAHMLSHDYVASSQGLAPDPSPYQINNAAESAYTVLPHVFTCKAGGQPVIPAIDQLALVVVSSRISDSVAKRRDNRHSTVYGEIVDISHLGGGQIRISRKRTFDGTYPEKQISSRPAIIIDEMHRLYEEGYRHIIYLAQSPHTSMLHLTQRDDEEQRDLDRAGLYYLSPEIIKALVTDKANGQAKAGLQIYPIFRDQYSAMPITAMQVASWEIADLHELERVVHDDNGRQMAVFLNLFSGKRVSQGKGNATDDRYHGVVSYATLLNYYAENVDEQMIRAGLIQPGAGRDTILRSLILFHIARNETASRELVIKLDPYATIIGGKSLGATSLRQHITERQSFNFLTFLSEVGNAMHAVRGEQG